MIDTTDKSGRSIGLVGAIAIGIGGMVGGGIFAVLGEAASIANGATAVAFAIAGVVAFLTAYSYAKLSVTYQNRGGTITFIDRAFDHDLFAGSMNVMLWLSYLVTISLYAVAFGAYAGTFFPTDHSPVLRHLLISAAILLPGIINLVNASVVSRSETFLVVVKLLILVFVVIVGMPYVEFERMSPVHWEAPLAIVTAGMVIFVAYEGFELIANAAEDIKEPEKNLPRAFFGSVVLVIVLYVLIAIITIGTVDEETLLQAKDYALAIAVKPALGEFGFTLVAVAALIATFSAINATIYGNSRLAYSLGIEGELPMVDKEGVDNPKYGVLTTIVLSLLMANLIDLTEIAIIGSASFLLIFTVTNLSAMRLYREVHGNRWFFLTAFLSSLAALITLMVHTYHSNPHAVYIFAAFIVLSLTFELTYGLFYRKRFTTKKHPRRVNKEQS